MSLLANTTYANPTLPFWIGKIEAGNGITILGTEKEPIIQSDGLYTATGGPGITVSGGQDIQIDNTGVLSVNAGTGISVSPDLQNPTITNDGILSVNAGTSIAIGGTLQNPIISNPDFCRRNYEDMRNIVNQGVTTEIVVFTQNFVLNPNTTYLHAFSFNNFSISAVPGTPSYGVISRILPQGVGFPGLIGNLLIQNVNSVWSDGRVGTFTTTNATNYTYELRVFVGSGTLNLRNVQTKLYRLT